MKNLDYIADELFNKIRGRYPNVTVGDSDATITNMPKEGRFFEFDFAKDKKVSVSLDEKGIAVMYSNKLFDSEDASLKSNWFAFLKELRQFAKKRMLNFDTRDITKNSLDKRDYEYLSTEKQMSESKLYGTSRTSFQDIGSAKMIVKHTQPINHEQPAGRTRDIAGIYIESENGERFKYPMKHLNGARAMTRHVSEGGNPYDDFGKHIIGLSEELSKLRKFKTYMNRSSVMAESLAGYLDIVNERIEAVKKSAHALQSVSHYKEAVENFETTVLEEVPEDVSNSWIDELTIKQFNEELKGVFPYIYKLVSEANKVKDIGPADLIGEGFDPEEFKGEFETTVSGDDGEEEGADIHYTAKIVNGKPVVDPKSIEVHAYGRNPSSKLGYDVENDTDMIMNYGGVDAEEIKREAQEDAEERWAERDNKYAQGEDFETEGKVKGMVMDMEDDAADMSRDDFIKKYGKHNVDIWDKVNDEDYRDPSDMAPENYDFEQIADDIVNGANFNQEAPMTEYERAFEDFKMAAANAAAKGEKDFEYPKGSGKKHPTKMDKATAAKLLADSQTNEGGVKQAEIEVQDWFNKFNEYKGTNADDLAQGWIRAVLDTGIMSDAYEENEVEAFNKKKGYPTDQIDQSWQRGDHEDFTSNKSGASPITAGMFSTINAIMNKYGIDEEQVDDMSKADDPSYGKPDMRVKDSIGEAQLDENILKMIGKGLGKVMGKVKDPKVQKGMAELGKKAADGAGKVAKGAGNVIKNNPKTAVGVGAGAYAVDKVGDGIDAVKDYANQLADKIPDVDDIKAMMPSLPNAGEIANIAKQYALPAAAVMGVLYLGYKGISALFGDDEKESDDAKTVDLSPGGKGDEMKQKNEIPIDEFVKSMYDYTHNAFPKGETAVLTAVQKQYGEGAVDDAAVIMNELLAGQDNEMARIQQLAGLR